MSKNELKTTKKNKKKSMASKFVRTFFTSVIIFLFCSSLAVLAYNLAGGKKDPNSPISQMFGGNLKPKGNILNMFEPVPEKLTMLLMGVDADGDRTDTMMVASFEPKTGKTAIISIPRDTYVVMPEDRREALKEEGKWTPDGMKLNEVNHYAGKEKGIAFLTQQIEELLGIKIEYYAKVDLDGFRYLIDEIGGVEIDVKERMYKKADTPDLTIDIQPGLQTLNGHDALGYVRYRSYAAGDWVRQENQKEFLKIVLKQVLNDGNILKNGTALLKTALNYVETNMSLVEATKYLDYALKIDADNIKTYNLQGIDGRVNGKAVVLLDEKAVREVIDEVFYSSPETSTEDGMETNSDSKDFTIQVLNGGYVSGLATKTKEFLEEKGYTVEEIGDYTGSKVDYTRIYVKEKGMGEDIKSLYDNSKIIVDAKSTKVYDIIIVLGTQEK